MLFLSKNVFFLQSIPPLPPVPAYNLDYLVVAGGGGGGSSGAEISWPGTGGGGAGGYRTGTLSSQTVARYTILIGAGGAGVSGDAFLSVKGQGTSLQSSAQTIISTGGGSDFTFDDPNSCNGGSGAGGCLAIFDGVGHLGIAGQGNNGGNGLFDFQFGGGGGAGQVGGSASTTAKGGDGLAWVDGIYRGGGGGGSRWLNDSGQVDSISGPGGLGGGGSGAKYVEGGVSQAANNAVQNTGGGGGVSVPVGFPVEKPGNGGSGIVKVRYTGTPRATGGTITQSGGFTYHEFTSSGILTFTS